MKKLYAFLLLLMACASLTAQTNPAPQTLPYTQDFSSFPATVTAYPAGWQGWTVATTFPPLGSPFPTNAPVADRTVTASGAPNSTTGSIYNYNERIGFLNTGSLDLSVVLALNTTGQSAVQIAYDIMTTRNPYDGGSNTRINELTLQYRVGTSGSFTSLTGIEYQNNTTTFTTGSFTTGTLPQNIQNKSITLPGDCDNQPVVQLRWMSRQVSGAGSRPAFAVDNVSATGGGTPSAAITVAGSFSGFTTLQGTASASQSVTVSGSNLTGNITAAVTPAATYEVSTDNINFSSSASLIQSGGIVAPASVFVRIAAGATAGAANGTLTLSSAGATDKTVGMTGTVNSSVNPPQSFSANTVSSSQIDLSGTGNAAGNNLLVAFNTVNTFGNPAGALVPGNTVSGGGTVLYNGAAAAFAFSHTGLNAGTTYFYKVWSVDGSNNYSATGLTASATTSAPPAANVVINQVYGGGGNTGATYKNDFIELYNNENTPVNLSGWSVQYTGATGNLTWQVTPLTGTIPAHGFYLIQEAAGATGTVNLPTPDATGTIPMGAGAGKVLLSNSTTAQAGDNPTGPAIMDKVGYASNATGFETAPTAAPDNTTSVKRITDGVDNNNNAADFALSDPLPRNKTYTTAPPLISALTPPNNFTSVPYNIVPTIVFDKPVQKGTGTITIFENSVAGTPIDVTSGNVVITGNNTVKITTALTGNKSYYIHIEAGAFKDVYGNNFAGINDNVTWTFNTYNATLPVPVPVTFDMQNCSGTALLPSGFTQYSETGNQMWDCTPFGRDPAAPAGTAAFPAGIQMNGFDNALSSNVINTDWLISPALDLTGTTFPLLSFHSRTRFNGQPLQLKVSTDYTGTGNPNLATWIDLNGKFPAQTSDTWTLSSNINLGSYKQTHVYIAFVYNSTNDDGARWTLDDISIINSATPPPPSLGTSVTDMDFLYTASASSTVKQFTVIGNDLTGGGGITLATGGSSFVLSKDNNTFASSINFTEGEANNIVKTVYVKFAPVQNDRNYNDSITVSTAGVTDIKVYLKGTSIDPAKTLEIVNWNMEWFGSSDPTLGPVNKALQKQNAQTILSNTGADLYALVEVVDTAALGNIVRTSMPGYSYIICNFGSHGNPFENAPSPMGELQKEAFVYKKSVFTNIDTTSLLSVGINTAADLSNPDYGYWSSGRFPYMFTADVTLGAVTKRIRFIAIHAKANTSPTITSYNRRKSGADDLHTFLNTTFPTDNLVILGDFNDDLDSTITDGITPKRLTSYSSFTDDVANFYSPTLTGLSLTGKKSTVKYNDVIDHVVVSNELQSFYMNGSVSVLTDVASLVANYGTTTSDHYPVFTRFAFDATILPVKVTKFTAVKQSNSVKVSWKTSEEINSREFVVERSTDGSNFTTIGIVAANGAASDYSLLDAKPVIGNNYYRLKLVDKDGKSDYTNIIKINFSKQLSVHIAPNPASTVIYVTAENAGSGVRLEIFDLNGKLVRQQQLTAALQQTPVSIAGLAKGIYTLKVVGAAEVATQKLVVQ